MQIEISLLDDESFKALRKELTDVKVQFEDHKRVTKEKEDEHALFVKQKNSEVLTLTGALEKLTSRLDKLEQAAASKPGMGLAGSSNTQGSPNTGM